MKRIFQMLFLFMVFCMCSVRVAVADTQTVGTNTMTVFDDLVHIAAYSLSLVLMGLLTMAVNKLRQKWHLDVPQAWLDKVHGYIDLGIAYAEEQAHKAASTVTFSGSQKLETALGFVLKFVGDDKRLVTLGQEKIKQLIEARLNQARMPTYNLAAIEDKSSDKNASPAVVHSVVNTGNEQVIIMNDGTVKPIAGKR